MKRSVLENKGKDLGMSSSNSTEELRMGLRMSRLNSTKDSGMSLDYMLVLRRSRVRLQVQEGHTYRDIDAHRPTCQERKIIK